jgi:hypothetical protein
MTGVVETATRVSRGADDASAPSDARSHPACIATETANAQPNAADRALVAAYPLDRIPESTV